MSVSGLSVSGLSRTYRENGVRACSDVSARFDPGRIHAVVGENGAGKSTLVRIVAGLETASRGFVNLDGRSLLAGSPAAAVEAGIRLVSQHPETVPGFSVWEQVALGGDLDAGSRTLRPRAVQKRIGESIEELSFPLSPNARVEELSAGELHFLAVLEAVIRKPRVLILDEPTAPLSDHEVSILFAAMRALRDAGATLLFISHKLREVQEIADHLWVMRKGKLLADAQRGKLSTEEVASLMLGEDCQVVDGDLRLARSSSRADAADGSTPSPPISPAPRIRVEKLTLVEGKHSVLSDVSFEVPPGRILGVTGIRSAGLEHLEDVLSGNREPSAGRIEINGKRLRSFSPASVREAGLSYVPTDRRGRGASLEASLSENLVLLERKSYFPRGLADRRAIEARAQDASTEYSIRARPSESLRRLSGGNLQKVILARELEREPKAVLFSEPSWGLDLRSRDFVNARILELRSGGAGILLISADVDDVLSLADEVIVFYEGHVAGRLATGERSRERVGELMLGLLTGDS